STAGTALPPTRSTRCSTPMHGHGSSPTASSPPGSTTHDGVPRMTLQDREHDPAAEPAPVATDVAPELGGTAESRAQEREVVAGVAGSRVAGALRLAALIALIIGLGVLKGLPIVVVIVAILVMIFLHELGHYLAARWSGMKATEFFIGFGPRIWS